MIVTKPYKLALVIVIVIELSKEVFHLLKKIFNIYINKYNVIRKYSRLPKFLKMNIPD